MTPTNGVVSMLSSIPALPSPNPAILTVIPEISAFHSLLSATHVEAYGLGFRVAGVFLHFYPSVDQRQSKADLGKESQASC